MYLRTSIRIKSVILKPEDETSEKVKRLWKKFTNKCPAVEIYCARRVPSGLFGRSDVFLIKHLGFWAGTELSNWRFP